MEKFEENLVGPRSDERSNESLSEEVTANGEPLWMAFLNDPNALTISKEEVQEAKNALVDMQNEQPDVIKMCAHKSLEECKSMVESLHSGNIAA